jgi:excisionase family DNA binding protein
MSAPTGPHQTSPLIGPQIGPLLTAREVADLLHIHPNTVKRISDRGELPFLRVCSRGDRRYRICDVEALLRRTSGCAQPRGIAAGARIVGPA